MNTMTYKGFIGSINISEDDGLLFGRVLGVRALLSYEGRTVPELIEDFHAAVDGYLEYCEDCGIAPEYEEDDFCDIQVPVSLYSKITSNAEAQKISTDRLIEMAIEAVV